MHGVLCFLFWCPDKTGVQVCVCAFLCYCDGVPGFAWWFPWLVQAPFERGWCLCLLCLYFLLAALRGERRVPLPEMCLVLEISGFAVF